MSDGPSPGERRTARRQAAALSRIAEGTVLREDYEAMKAENGRMDLLARRYAREAKQGDELAVSLKAERDEALAALREMTHAGQEALVVLAALKHGDRAYRHAPDVWTGILNAHDLLFAALSNQEKP